MKVPIIVCLPTIDSLWWKNIFPDDFSLKNLSLFHIRNTKSSQAMETGNFENSFKSKFENQKCLRAHPVITNTLS